MSNIFKKSINKIKYLPSCRPYLTTSKRDQVYNPEIFKTLRENKPVMALESTADKVKKAINGALAEAKEISKYPFLLKRVNEITQRDSLKLIKNNGSRFAKYLASSPNVFKEKITPFFKEPLEKPPGSSSNKELIIVGGTAVDITSTLDPLVSKSTSYINTSSPGTTRQSIGGVGRNVAETSFRLGAKPLFISAIGNDLSGNWLKSKFEKIGMETDGLQIINNESTAIYNAIHDSNGNLICAVADMKIFDSLSSDKVSQVIKTSKPKPKLVCFDGNISAECIYSILNTCNTYNVPTFFETTSISKSLKLFKDYNQFISLLSSQSLKYISPNSFELETMYFEAREKGVFENCGEWSKKINEYGIGPKFICDIEHLSKQIPAIKALVSSGLFVQIVHFLPFIPNIIVKLGENGILLAQSLKDWNFNNSKTEENDQSILKDNEKNEIIIKGRDGKSGLRFRYFKPIKFDKNEIVNVTGAGDSVVGTLVSGLILHDETKIDEIIEVAQYIALMTLKSHNSVSESINEKLLNFNN